METLSQKIAHLTSSLQNGLLELSNSFKGLSDNYEGFQFGIDQAEVPKKDIAKLRFGIENLEKIQTELDKDYGQWLQSDIQQHKVILINHIDTLDRISKNLDFYWFSTFNSSSADDRFRELWRHRFLMVEGDYRWMLMGYYSDYSVQVRRERLREVFRDENPFHFELDRVRIFCESLIDVGAKHEVKMIISHIWRRWEYQIWQAENLPFNNIYYSKLTLSFKTEPIPDPGEWFLGQLNQLALEFINTKFQITKFGRTVVGYRWCGSGEELSKLYKSIQPFITQILREDFDLVFEGYHSSEISGIRWKNELVSEPLYFVMRLIHYELIEGTNMDYSRFKVCFRMPNGNQFANKVDSLKNMVLGLKKNPTALKPETKDAIDEAIRSCRIRQ